MMALDEIRNDTRHWLRLAPAPRHVHVVTEDVAVEESFERRRIVFSAPDGDLVPAFLLVPIDRRLPLPAVLVHHQHKGERHLGKSEVCGVAGDPLQAFGVALAQRGFVVLAPDSICFEDRRAGRSGVEPHISDWQQHYNEMTYRLVRGDTLMRKVLDDAAAAISVLNALDIVDASRTGALGHSYGGNTVLFQAALDERVRFACASGAVCSYRHKMEHGTGIEMAEVLPDIVGRLDVDDLLCLMAPRPMLVVSASDDPYSADATDVVRRARNAYADAHAPDALEHADYDGGHAMTRERFDHIVDWFAQTATNENGGPLQG